MNVLYSLLHFLISHLLLNPGYVCMLSHFCCVQLFVTPWIVAHQTPMSKGFSRQEYWSGLSCPSPGDLSHLRIEPMSLYVCCIGRQVLYHECHLGSQDNTY